VASAKPPGASPAPSGGAIAPDTGRVVIHFDADQFYAQVEEVSGQGAVSHMQLPPDSSPRNRTTCTALLVPHCTCQPPSAPSPRAAAGAGPFAARPPRGSDTKVSGCHLQSGGAGSGSDKADGYGRGAAALPQHCAGQVGGRAGGQVIMMVRVRVRA
jgi:hypothetical protein